MDGFAANINEPGGETAPTRGELLSATALYLAVLLVLLGLTGRTPVNDGRGHDGRFYAAMAADEGLKDSLVGVSPYCYRILTPMLARLLPGGVVERFVALNLVTWLATLVAWHILARRSGLPRVLAVFGALLYAASAWGPMNAFYNPCYVDPLMHLFLVVGLLLMLGRSRWLLVLLPIAVMQREQAAVMLLICAAVHHWMGGMSAGEGVDTTASGSWPPAAPLGLRAHGCSHGRRGRRPLHRAVVARLDRRGIELVFAALACVFVFVGLRMTIRPVGGTAPAPWTTAFAVAFNLYDNPRYLAGSVLAVAYALGVPLTGALLLPGARGYLQRHRWPLYFLFLCLLSLFGGSDKARLAFAAMPVLLLLMLHGLRDLIEPGPNNDTPVSIAAGMATVSRAGRPVLLLLAGLLIVHIHGQFPPALMHLDGHLIAPLIDDPDRGTHLASGIIPAVWPVSLGMVGAHLALTMSLAAIVFCAARIDRAGLGGVLDRAATEAAASSPW